MTSFLTVNFLTIKNKLLIHMTTGNTLQFLKGPYFNAC